MTTTPQRKAQTGEPTTNGGHFGSVAKTEAPEGLLTQRRAEFSREQLGIARAAERAIAQAELADFASWVTTNIPEAMDLRLDADEDDDEMVWVRLFDIDGGPLDEDDRATGELNANYDFDRMNSFTGQSFSVAQQAAWDPTGDCERHGGRWGEDATCNNCTFATGEPMPRS
jgi:hypothetical protein